VTGVVVTALAAGIGVPALGGTTRLRRAAGGALGVARLAALML
jgi:hypothetical protein